MIPFIYFFFNIMKCFLQIMCIQTLNFHTLCSTINISYFFLYRVFCYQTDKCWWVIVDMKISIIKWETMEHKRNLQELGDIKIQGQKLHTMIKNGKKVDSFVVFAKIILFIAFSFKKIFKSKIQKMSIEGALDFRVTNNYFLP